MRTLRLGAAATFLVAVVSGCSLSSLLELGGAATPSHAPGPAGGIPVATLATRDGEVLQRIEASCANLIRGDVVRACSGAWQRPDTRPVEVAAGHAYRLDFDAPIDFLFLEAGRLSDLRPGGGMGAADAVVIPMSISVDDVATFRAPDPGTWVFRAEMHTSEEPDGLFAEYVWLVEATPD